MLETLLEEDITELELIEEIVLLENEDFEDITDEIGVINSDPHDTGWMIIVDLEDPEEALGRGSPLREAVQPLREPVVDGTRMVVTHGAGTG